MAILKLNQGHFHTGNFLMWQTDAKKKKSDIIWKRTQFLIRGIARNSASQTQICQHSVGDTKDPARNASLMSCPEVKTKEEPSSPIQLRVYEWLTVTGEEAGQSQ